MAVTLAVKRVGQGPAVVLLHGLFGAGSNLGALARSLQDEYTVFTVDLPNHGHSDWLKNPDLSSMAETVRDWLEGEGVKQAHLLGHSLGGKIAMQLALLHPQRVESLAVADIAPVSYPARHDGVFDGLSAVAAAQCSNRRDAAKVMARYVHDDAVIQFLLTNVKRDADGVLRWRFDLEGIKAAYPALLSAPSAGATYTGSVLFIKGGESDYIQEQYWPAIQSHFPKAEIKIMPGCGHWLHAENPTLFNGIVARFLEQQNPRMLSSKQGQRDRSQ